MRIQHAIDDQVILLLGGAEEIPRVVDRQVDAGVVVWTLGMIFGAKECDRGIDFDGIDMGSAHPQRGRHVIAAAGADDGHALRRLLEIVGKLVIGAHIAIGVGFMAAPVFREVIDLLVVAAARQDLHQAVRLGSPLQQLVRRIDALRLRLHRPGQDAPAERRSLRSRAAGSRHATEQTAI